MQPPREAHGPHLIHPAPCLANFLILHDGLSILNDYSSWMESIIQGLTGLYVPLYIVYACHLALVHKAFPKSGTFFVLGLITYLNQGTFNWYYCVLNARTERTLLRSASGWRPSRASLQPNRPPEYRHKRRLLRVSQSTVTSSPPLLRH